MLQIQEFEQTYLAATTADDWENGDLLISDENVFILVVLHEHKHFLCLDDCATYIKDFKMNVKLYEKKVTISNSKVQ